MMHLTQQDQLTAFDCVDCRQHIVSSGGMPDDQCCEICRWIRCNVPLHEQAAARQLLIGPCDG